MSSLAGCWCVCRIGERMSGKREEGGGEKRKKVRKKRRQQQ
jgi:hypothetical protein